MCEGSLTDANLKDKTSDNIITLINEVGIYRSFHKDSPSVSSFTLTE